MTPLLGPENDAKKSPPKTGFSVDLDPGRPYKAKKKKQFTTLQNAAFGIAKTINK